MSIFDLIQGKIVLSNQIEKLIQEIKSINWFRNCGKEYKEYIYFQYVQENDIKIATKRLNQNVNSKGFVTLENLLINADSRQNWYLYNHFSKEHKIIANGRLADTIRKQFKKDLTEINIDKIGIDFNDKFHVGLQKFNFISWVFWGTLFEIQLLEQVPELPAFYTKIFDVYQNGHILVGWNGKFPPQNLCLEEPITNENGNLIIF